MEKTTSDEYVRAIAEGARHHADSKTYSGSLLRPHKPYLIERSRALGCRSGVDIGAGKGVQYEWIDPSDGLTIEQALGFDIVKHDPCWPPFAAEPQGPFDMAICTHTISLIPMTDLEWFTQRLFGYATKFLFVAEKIGDRKKGDVADPARRAIGWSAIDWVEWLDTYARMYPRMEAVLSLTERLPRGKITTRHRWTDGAYAGAEEAMPREMQE
jgi:hypothetical protein